MDFDPEYSDRLVRCSVGLTRNLRQCSKLGVSDEDVLQEVYYIALLEQTAIRQMTDAQLRVWLSTVTTRMVIRIDRMRKAKKRGSNLVLDLDKLLDDDSKNAPVDSRTPGRIASKNERMRILRDAIASIDERYSTVLHLIYYQEITVEDLARKIGRSKATSYERIAAAETVLERELRRRGITSLSTR